MKGTLFSADFIKDSTDNLRLLELNTDTSFTSGALSQVDFDPLLNIISSSNITEVDVIYKENIHGNFVTQLSQSLQSSLSGVALNLHVEDSNTIYPTAIADSATKFILRCAYDESAIFDSEYCKQTDKLYKLFSDNSNTGAIPNFYISSSDFYQDNLLRVVNSSTSPDIAVKNIEDVHEPITFYKSVGSGSADQHIDFLISNLSGNKLAVSFYEDTSSLNSKSIRSFNIIYGSNLDIVELANVHVESVLSKPTTLSYDENGLVDDKHYFELTTNHPNIFNYGGIFEEEEILDTQGNPVLVSEVVIGNKYASTFISGSPDSDDYTVYSQWSFPGSTLPSGSYTTSSILVNSISQDLEHKTILNLTTENSSSIRINTNQYLLVYDSNEDKLTYKSAYDIDPSIDKFIGSNNNVVNIASNELEVLEGDHKTYLLDLEAIDTYVLNTEGINIKIVAHNCHPAGTKILLSDGTYKNIEDITTEDVLLTYNETKKEYGAGKASTIRKTTQNHLSIIKFENGEEVRSTPPHRYFTNSGWKTASSITEGDLIFNKDGILVKVVSSDIIEGEFEVYHLIDVKDDHTYFAEDLLVHNLKAAPTCFSAGTRITLSNHDEKYIEDVVVGDEVLGWDGEKLTPGLVVAIDHRHTVGSHADACKALGDAPSLYTINETGIEFTPEHPFLTKDGWKALVPDIRQEPFLSQQEPKSLTVGDFILRNEEWEEITEIRTVRSDADETVYNITVEGLHSYVADGIIVHNK